MIDFPKFNQALERGLEAAYRTQSKGYLGGNLEGKIREAVFVAFEHYFDEVLPVAGVHMHGKKPGINWSNARAVAPHARI